VTSPHLLTGAVLAVLARQLFVLAGTVASVRFLRLGPDRLADPSNAGPASGGGQPRFLVVVPVLREAAVLADAVAHLRAMTAGHTAQVVIVTTAREAAEARQHPTAPDTVAAAARLACPPAVVHMHYPDPAGLKGDQLNHAAACCATTVAGDTPTSELFVVCYDADSRPPLDSLTCFARAIAAHPNVSVFHQSSRFEHRLPHRPAGSPGHSRLSRTLNQAAALRANRFVLGFEIPRLRNRQAANRLKRAACRAVYAHVTGHGLCLRLRPLLDLPFPRRSPLEDMHYSFYLGSRGLPIVALPGLDHAEVPAGPHAQLQQAARWFAGPGRFRRYLRDPATQPGWRARLMAVSALGSALEWLGCAVVPAGTLLLICAADGTTRATALTLAAVYLTQLVLTDRTLHPPAPALWRTVRILACPAAATLFGLGGFLGAARLLTGRGGTGKTERPPRP